jgi:ribosomal protein L7/L12
MVIGDVVSDPNSGDFIKKVLDAFSKKAKTKKDLLQGLEDSLLAFKKLHHVYQTSEIDLNRAREAHDATRRFADEDRQDRERIGLAYSQLQHMHEQRGLVLDNANKKLKDMDHGHAYLRAVLLDAINTSPELQKFVMRQVADILRDGVDRYFQNSTWRVVLLDARGNGISSPRIACIKVVREMLNIGLKEAKDMTDPSVEDPPRPVLLAKGIDAETADRWRAAFESCTAKESKYSIERE